VKIYTKTGDQGTTSLLTGTRVSKSDMRLEAYGTLDELNSWIGLVSAEVPQGCFPMLHEIQSELFSMGSYLALDGKASFPMPKINSSLVLQLESQIDSWSQELPELKNFILPNGSKASSMCHVARTICRRSERLIVALSEQVEVKAEIPLFLNRLSDFLFVQARYVLYTEGLDEVVWTPNY
jgi:cob(I)alamin adenosyltransferase